MSVRARIDDAKALYGAHRIEGCLLLLLVAVAATSRKRYPKTRMNDGDAFKTFLHDEMHIKNPGKQGLQEASHSEIALPHPVCHRKP